MDPCFPFKKEAKSAAFYMMNAWYKEGLIGPEYGYKPPADETGKGCYGGPGNNFVISKSTSIVFSASRKFLLYPGISSPP